MERCVYNAMEVNLKNLMHAMVMYRGTPPLCYWWYGRVCSILCLPRYHAGPPLYVASGIVCHTYPTKPGPGSSLASSPGGPTVTRVGHVWESTMHPPPPGQSKSLRPWEGMEDRPLSRFLSFNTCAHVGVLCVISMCIVCDCLYLYVWLFAYPNSGVTYWVFYIILKPRATHFFR